MPELVLSGFAMHNSGQGCRRCLRGGCLPAWWMSSSIARCWRRQRCHPCPPELHQQHPGPRMQILAKTQVLRGLVAGRDGGYFPTKAKSTALTAQHRYSSRAGSAHQQRLLNTAMRWVRRYFQHPDQILFKARWPPKHFQHGQELPAAANRASQLHHSTHTDHSRSH